MMRPRTIVAGSGIVLVAGAMAAITTLLMLPPVPAAAPSALPPATAEVTRGTLVDTKTVTGTLSYGELSPLRPSVAGTSAMVTWLAPVGAIVERGKPLYGLDGRPAILFYGAAPLHRTLRFEPGNTVPVWVELEQAQIAVKSAELSVELEQKRLADAEERIVDTTARLDDALSPLPARAEFVQLAGAVSTAEAKVGRVKELAAAELTPSVEIEGAQAELAAARANLDAALRTLRRDKAGAELDAVIARVALADAQAKLADLGTVRDDLTARASNNADVRQIADNLAALGYQGPLSDQIRAWQRDAGLPVTGIVGPSELIIAPGPVHIAAHSASIGETLVAASADRGSILDYSGTEKHVTVPLNVGDQGFATLGRVVVITLPDDTEVKGTIAEIGSVVTDGKIELTIDIADQAALGGLGVASVDVKLASGGRDNVLSVPVAALLALPQGGFAVEMVTGGRSAVVPVRTGLFAAGRVEVSGDGITEGVRVGVPR